MLFCPDSKRLCFNPRLLDGVVLLGCLLLGADVHSQVFTNPVSFTSSDITGIGKNNQSKNGVGVLRRDPSDVIKLGDTYYVFYTRALHSEYAQFGGDGSIPKSSGYYGTVWYATSADGVNWTERDQALGRGGAGKFDSNAVFTPNVFKAPDGEVYLFYTGVPLGFKNNSNTDFTNIGAAKLSFDAGGLITDAVRLNGGAPVLNNTQGQAHQGVPLFDSYRVDDASLLVRDYDHDGDLDIGLYYKGRAQNGTPGQTDMGLAIAQDMTGPFVRHPHSVNGQMAQDGGHEVMVFVYQQGVASIVSSVGHGVYFDEQGVVFSKVADFTGAIHAPGAYRAELTDSTYTGGVEWGISMIHNGNTPYLVRWEVEGLLTVPAPKPANIALWGLETDRCGCADGGAVVMHKQHHQIHGVTPCGFDKAKPMNNTLFERTSP